MKNETDFKTKFRLLNSQENNEEIIWSCSDSSDYDNSNINEKNKSFSRKHVHGKRKRKPSKKVLKNISNLDITIIDGTQDQSIENGYKSPILGPSNSLKKDIDQEKNKIQSSNINERQPPSPILGFKNKKPGKTRCKSPILVPKIVSSPNVSKKLFKDEYGKNTKRRCTSPILRSVPNDKKTCLEVRDKQNISIKSELLDKESSEQNNSTDLLCKTKCDDDLSLKNSDLIVKVRNYFTSNFSSDSLSQLSISDYATPKNSSKTSDEVEISEISQKSGPIPIEGSTSTNTNMESESKDKNKKSKYKKDGLAYRLNDLLKKQNAKICLWQHERFLAANSNFVIPKGAFILLRVKNVHNKFGSYLISAINDKDEEFLILINYLYCKDKIESNVIFKLYEPYKVLPYNDLYKLIVNVCKYECLTFTP
ncbi:uncharacterized protein LOC119838916 [Zerene cesonia]|uniref:uncharacterized protein LOC119838916 n=1 Tax=Zerene cesonia TaxID=33412 RepID=UPI0018E5410E|nr:uncharacterized protein LOC119838916 [Zerene cesonia]